MLAIIFSQLFGIISDRNILLASTLGVLLFTLSFYHRKIADWRIVGLNPIETIFGKPVDKSYRAKIDQSFWLEVDVLGTQQVGKDYLEFDEIAEDLDHQVILASLTVQVPTDHHFIKSFKRVAIPGGARLRYQMIVPSAGELKLHGIKFLRFY